MVNDARLYVRPISTASTVTSAVLKRTIVSTATGIVTGMATDNARPTGWVETVIQK